MPKRRLLIVLLLLVAAGAIVNVAVAWGCGISVNRKGPRHGQGLDGDAGLKRLVDFGVPSADVGGIGGITAGDWRGTTEVIDYFLTSEPPPGSTWHKTIHWTTGWPVRSVAFDQSDGKYRVPRPLWPGFALNTAFYAEALWGVWLLFAAPFALRRRSRIQRGLCPKCAYPIGTSGVCTKCGTSVQSRRGAGV